MRILQLLTIVAVVGTLVPLGRAQDTNSLKTLYSFTGGPDGGDPLAAVVIGAKGALYGTTNSGGTSNQGTVFELKPPASPGGAWTETVIDDFTGSPLASPHGAGVAIGAGGVLFGSISTNRSGTVFSLTPPAAPGGAWTETVLWTPIGPLGTGVVVGGGGVLYGTTGPYFGCGIRCAENDWFSLTPPASPNGSWTEATLYTFKGTCPTNTTLVIGSGGVLYGTELGTAQSLTPPASPGGSWTEALLFVFPPEPCPNPMSALAIGGDGVLYGTNLLGGPSHLGTAYSLTPPTSPGGAWTETALWTFAGGGDGASPKAGLVIGTSGVLYGTTAAGGTSNAGTVYSLTPPASQGEAWTETVLWSFTGGLDGGSPVAGMAIGKNGVLYGTTSSGGASNAGTVFALKP